MNNWNIDDWILCLSRLMKHGETQVLSKSRTRELVDSRRVIVLILSERGFSESEIAKGLEKDRTTIRHLLESGKFMVEKYQGFRNLYYSIKSKFDENQADKKPTGRHPQSPPGDAPPVQA